ncbi:unnamed protein product [Tenebrio molitor]|nr:unnamed protein product [Tenebrio molitor]
MMSCIVIFLVHNLYINIVLRIQRLLNSLSQFKLI